MKQVCEVDSAEKPASSRANISALDGEQTSSWSPESASSMTTDESLSRAKVEAVTLMLTVQPGT